MQTTPQRLADDYRQKGWWGDETLSSLFRAAVESAPDREALADPPNRPALTGGAPKRLTYAELDAEADAFARAFYAAGLRQGDKIVLQLPNTVEIVIAYLAAARLGLIVSPVAMQYGRFELEHVAPVVEPSAYLAFERFTDASFGAERASWLGETCVGLMVPAAGGAPVVEAQSADQPYEDYLAGLEHGADDIFTICWTSGTTGRPKGVPRSHNHWLSSTLASEDAIRLREGDVMLNPFPFINMAAIGGFLYYWLKLRTLMALHHPFDPNVYLQQLQDEGAVYSIAPPAVLNRLLQMKDMVLANFDLSKLKIIGSGSAPLASAMVAGVKEAFDVDVVNMFGSNEGMALISDTEDVPDPVARAACFPRFGRDEHIWSNRIGAQLRTRLVCPESGEEITEAGESGEMLIAGPTVFDGYYRADADNAAVFSEDGYFHTGDLFQIAGENNELYRFVGRCKDIIVRGGMNISPEELDELLQAHPHIIEAAVCACPDEIMGEKVGAVVVTAPGVELDLKDLCAFLEERGVAKFKWPEKMVLAEVLPRNPMNKVVRKDLAALFAGEA